MSYARRGPDSDVYVFDDGNLIVCEHCSLLGTFESRPAEMLAHLQRHVEADHRVPDYAIERLRGELQQPGQE